MRNEICIEDRWKKKGKGKETERKVERRGGRREKGRGWRENGREKGGKATVIARHSSFLVAF